MATGDVPITPGIGANVATYEVTEDAKQKDIQRIALSDSAGADALGVVGAAAWASGNGTLISLLKAIAGVAVDNTTVSPVVNPGAVITVTPTLDTLIYAAGDVLFATTAIAGAARAADKASLLESLIIIDKDDQKPAFDLDFYSANVTSGAFNGAPSISDADFGSYLGTVSIVAADYKDRGGASGATKTNIGLMLKPVAAGTSVYCFGVLTAGNPTHTASGIILQVGVLFT